MYDKKNRKLPFTKADVFFRLIKSKSFIFLLATFFIVIFLTFFLKNNFNRNLLTSLTPTPLKFIVDEDRSQLSVESILKYSDIFSFDDLVHLSNLEYVEDLSLQEFLFLSSFELNYYSTTLRSHLGHPQNFLLLANFGNHYITKLYKNLFYTIEGKSIQEIKMCDEISTIPLIGFKDFVTTNELLVGDVFYLSSFIRYPDEEYLERGYKIIETSNLNFYNEDYIYDEVIIAFELVGILDFIDYSRNETIIDKNTLFIPFEGFLQIRYKINNSIYESWNNVTSRVPDKILSNLVQSEILYTFTITLNDKKYIPYFLIKLKGMSSPFVYYKLNDLTVGE